jgi:isopentenyl-diphosphate delta-isomerase
MEYLILCDEQGNPIGKATVEEGHKGEGLRHLAFVIFIFNSNKEILIQKRAENKRFPEYWEIPASHLFYGESWEEALVRTLRKELGINYRLTFKRIFSFNYNVKGEREKDVENEHCVVFTCKYDGPIKMNSNEISEFKFVKFNGINLSQYKFAAWFTIPYKILIEKYTLDELIP